MSKVGRRKKGLTTRTAILTAKVEPIVKDVICNKFGSFSSFVDHFAYSLEELKDLDPKKIAREREIREIDKERHRLEKKLAKLKGDAKL